MCAYQYIAHISWKTLRVERAFELTKSVKGEPPVSLPNTFFVSSAADYDYDALAQLATLKGL
jgi:hypothetical protein